MGKQELGILGVIVTLTGMFLTYQAYTKIPSDYPVTIFGVGLIIVGGLLAFYYGK